MIRKRQLILDYQQKFGDEQGDRILKDLRKICVMFDRPVKGGDPIALAIMIGESNVIKHIYRMLGKDPNAPIQSTAINLTSETGE